MSGTEDNDIQEYFIANAFPKEQAVQDIEKADRGMSPAEIKALVNTPDGKIDTALKFLQAESHSHRTFRPKAEKVCKDS